VLLSAKKFTFIGAQGILVVGRDMTARHRADQAQKESHRAKMAESLVLMAGGVAHDFNNILQALLTSLDLLALLSRDLAETGPVIAMAKATLSRGTKLSWKMLDFSGYFAPSWSNVVLADLLSSWAARQPAALRGRLDLELEAVPPIRADGSKLITILDELLVNALEAMEEGGLPGGRIEIRLFAGPPSRRNDTWVLPPPEGPGGVGLDFFNEGPIPDPEVVTRMFDPFFSTKALGRGLGLASVLGLLRAHGAGLQILPEAGRGLRFRIQFR
jgi:signal transduction histidine kinase